MRQTTIPDGDDNTVYIEVFDKDKIGKDKSLGSLSLTLDEVRTWMEMRVNG